jgi:hypothetical protein
MMISHATLTMLATALLAASSAHSDMTLGALPSSSLELEPRIAARVQSRLDAHLQLLTAVPGELPAAPAAEAGSARLDSSAPAASDSPLVLGYLRPSLYIHNGRFHFITTTPRGQR